MKLTASDIILGLLLIALIISVVTYVYRTFIVIPEIYNIEKRKGVLKKLAPKIKKVYLLDIKQSGKDNQIIEIKFFLEKYFAGLNLVMEGVQKNILILDSIDHGKQLESNPINKAIAKFYSDYFQIIEKIVKKYKNVTYIRVLQLPYDKSEAFHDILRDRQKTINYAKKNLYQGTLKHITNLMEANCENFKLYFLEQPLRFHSEAIIDDEIWINELDICDGEGGSPRPDRLFINLADEASEMRLAIQYEGELIMRSIIDRKAITKEEFLNSNMDGASASTKKIEPVKH